MKDRTIPIKAVAYCRVSTKDKQEQSIPNQRAVIERYATANNIKVIKYFIDDGVSGTDTRHRKAFLDMISEGTSKDCPFSVILTLDISRFSRLSPDHAAYFEHLLHENGVGIRYITEPLIGDGSMSDSIVKVLKRAMACEFSKDQAKKTIRGSITYTKLGYSVGGRPPYAYDRLLVDRNGKPIKVLKPGQRKSEKTEHVRYVLGDPEKVRIVKKIFDMVANKNLGLRKIAHILNRRKIPSPTEKLWCFSTLKSIIKNPAYMGTKIWNKSNRCNSSFDWKHDNIDVRIGEKKIGAPTRWKEKEEWIIAENAHKPIISRKVFQKAQDVLAKRRKYFSGSKMLKKNANKKKRKNRKVLMRKNIILTKIQRHESFTLGTLAEKFKVTRRSIERDIAELKMEGKIRYIGTNRNGHYELLKN